MDGPDVIYHYTDANGLIGILRSSTIRASEALFLNDSSEIRYSLGRVLDRIDKAIDREVNRKGSPNVETLEIMKYFLRELNDLSGQDCLPPVYVSCFCGDGDLLSQWRGYGGGQGFAIGFNKEKLARSASFCAASEGVKLVRVTYGSSSDGTINDTINVDREFAGGFSGEPARDHIMRNVLPLLAQIKDPSFQEEDEYRLVLIPYMAPDGELMQFRPSKFSLVPFIEMAFSLDCVERVVVGPGVHYDVNRLAVWRVLQSVNRGDVEIIRSASPYRY